MKTLLLSVVLTACGPTYVGPQELPKEEPTASPGEVDEGPPREPQVQTTTTTTTTTTVAGDSSVESSVQYRLNSNGEFASSNFCLGSNLRDCWLKSGILTAFPEGGYEVSLEFWDTYGPVPYTVFKRKTDGEVAILLTDKAKILGDDDFGYRMLWAVVRPGDRAVDLVYDYALDGPAEQGDELLETLDFRPEGD